MRARVPVGAVAAAALVFGGGLAATAQGCQALAGPWCSERTTALGLTATGPVRVDGTTATAVFEVGERRIRQFRYVDRGELGYTFVLHNDGARPVTVAGVAPAGAEATLLHVDRLQRAGTSGRRFVVPADGEIAVRLVLDMTHCERVSSRAGSFLRAVTVRTESGGMSRRQRVALPEELHTGSPREARCSRATSKSRSLG